MTANSPKAATDPKVDQVLIDRLRTLLDVRETRYMVLVTDERQQRVFDAREVSLAEMVAILDANGLLPTPSAPPSNAPTASRSSAADRRA